MGVGTGNVCTLSHTPSDYLSYVILGPACLKLHPKAGLPAEALSGGGTASTLISNSKICNGRTRGSALPVPGLSIGKELSSIAGPGFPFALRGFLLSQE